ncbi:MAG: Orotate phosphoribosyltransferase, partial [uncultured Acidimicrobiales bacterium]
ERRPGRPRPSHRRDVPADRHLHPPLRPGVDHLLRQVPVRGRPVVARRRRPGGHPTHPARDRGAGRVGAGRGAGGDRALARHRPSRRLRPQGGQAVRDGEAGRRGRHRRPARPDRRGHRDDRRPGRPVGPRPAGPGGVAGRGTVRHRPQRRRPPARRRGAEARLAVHRRRPGL